MYEQLMVLQDIREAVGDREFRLMQAELVERIRELARDAARYRWLVQERYEFGYTRCADDSCMTAPIGLWVAYKGPNTALAVGEAIDSDRAAVTVSADSEDKSHE